jgi:hypothetical protein
MLCLEPVVECGSIIGLVCALFKLSEIVRCSDLPHLQADHHSMSGKRLRQRLLGKGAPKEVAAIFD